MAHIGVALLECAWSLTLLIGFGLSGFTFVRPFRDLSRYVVLAAPFAGLLILSFLTLGAYVVLKQSFEHSAILACIVTWIPSLWLFWRRPEGMLKLQPMLILASICIVITLTCCGATIRTATSAIGFFEGSDHAGYAQMADWLVKHDVLSYPRASADAPYESWPENLFTKDPRFGSFAYLALVATARRTSGLFAYDSAVSVALTAAIAAIAGVVGSRLWTVAFLAAGLYTTAWYPYGQTGYFGKLIAFPGIVFLSVLTLRYLNSIRVLRTPSASFCLLFITASLSVTYSGVVVAQILLLTCGLSIVLVLRSKPWRDLQEDAISVALICLVAVCASGVLARPTALTYPEWGVGPAYVIFRALDLESQGSWITTVPAALRSSMLVAAILLWFVCLAMAWRSSRPEPCALILSAGLLCGGLCISGQWAGTLQVMGLPFPLTLCGTCLLLAEWSPDRRIVVALFSCAVLQVGLRVPRLAFDLDRYVLNYPSPRAYTMRDIDRIVAQVAGRTPRIDIADLNSTLLLLDEFGRRGVAVQFDKVAWNSAVGYRGWALPTYAAKPDVAVSWQPETGYKVAPLGP